MSANPVVNSEQQPEITKANDKELNFRKQEAMYQKMLEEERKARSVAEKQLQEIASRSQTNKDEDDEYDNDEPYIDKKTLEKKLKKVTQSTFQETDSRIQNAVQKALSEERKTQWMKNNPDFYEVMQHAQAFADRDPELAETILEMPEGFERQKLVYKNIKALGIHKKEDPKSSIQETVDKNRRNPYYQPTGIGTAPYGVIAGGKDYSPSEGQNAYKKMQELKGKLRI